MVVEVGKFGECCRLLDENLDNNKEINFFKDLFSKGKIVECFKDADDIFGDEFLEILITFRGVVDFELVDSKLSFGEWMKSPQGVDFTWIFQIFVDGSGLVNVLTNDGAGVGGLEF